MNKDIVWHQHDINKAARAEQKGHKAFLLWFTGLSGSGKSTIAGALEQELFRRGVHTYLLDGDNVRHGLCKGLGFTTADRQENLRRVGEAAKLMVDAGLVVLAAFVSPYRADRDAIRALLPEGEFVEVFVDTPLAECEQRDPKGLYKKARAGEIKHFTGIDDPYEAPVQPEVHIHNHDRSVEEVVAEVLAKLQARELLS
ncbi:adenylylsulfate kinase [Tolumonas auensis DSM 9187]|uniref:Adenylyl-sulfate kinase n=1 Tax=Tolumonas auensis (strain DSM 9187 / NBRC 110442 / TA 4) TaxID=595494 RepID=C4LAG2_TOLAT|nr:adenylyl-sulfate kinase [Tolumonas auensis]ACQ94137.1 adenylylsulfate kinase [Tolumonas auensis DSM 9187]